MNYTPNNSTPVMMSEQAPPPEFQLLIEALTGAKWTQLDLITTISSKLNQLLAIPVQGQKGQDDVQIAPADVIGNLWNLSREYDSHNEQLQQIVNKLHRIV